MDGVKDFDNYMPRRCLEVPTDPEDEWRIHIERSAKRGQRSELRRRVLWFLRDFQTFKFHKDTIFVLDYFRTSATHEILTFA